MSSRLFYKPPALPEEGRGGGQVHAILTLCGMRLGRDSWRPVFFTPVFPLDVQRKSDCSNGSLVYSLPTCCKKKGKTPTGREGGCEHASTMDMCPTWI